MGVPGVTQTSHFTLGKDWPQSTLRVDEGVQLVLVLPPSYSSARPAKEWPNSCTWISSDAELRLETPTAPPQPPYLVELTKTRISSHTPAPTRSSAAAKARVSPWLLRKTQRSVLPVQKAAFR